MCEYDSSTGIIKITKGDRCEIPVTLKDKATGETHTWATGDSLKMTVRLLPNTDSEVIFSVTSSTSTITLHGSDTTDVPVGQYSCDIQYNQAAYPNDPITVFPNNDTYMAMKEDTKNFKNLWILPEVTNP